MFGLKNKNKYITLLDPLGFISNFTKLSQSKKPIDRFIHSIFFLYQERIEFGKVGICK